MHASLSRVQRAVIKVGTGVLTHGVGQLEAGRLLAIAAVVAQLRRRGIRVIVVSSGAVGLGMGRLGLQKRPKALDELQACAAIGQSLLMNTWAASLEAHELITAQVLLTREDFRARERYTAVKAVLERLLARGVVPVVNENDCVSSAEISFGDNDLLSALVAGLANAQLLGILSTIPGLLDLDKGGRLVSEVPEITPAIKRLARGTDSPTAVGGMSSKIEAAKVATRAGCGMFIGSGQEPGYLLDLLDGQNRGTYFHPAERPVKSRKRWLAEVDQFAGMVHVDHGAARALAEQGSSLLIHGVTRVEGQFDAGSVVKVVGPDGISIAIGVAGLSADELASLTDHENRDAFGDSPETARREAIHRDSLVLR